MLRRTLLRRIGAGFVCLVVAIVCLGTYMMRHIEGQSVGSVPKTVTSRDGTVIAYEQTGAGPVVILVSAALADRGGTTRLANHLAQRFTVINYDRRGRGKSTDTQPYAVQHEVDALDRCDTAGPCLGQSSYANRRSWDLVVVVVAHDLATKRGPRM